MYDWGGPWALSSRGLVWAGGWTLFDWCILQFRSGVLVSLTISCLQPPELFQSVSLASRSILSCLIPCLCPPLLQDLNLVTLQMIRNQPGIKLFLGDPHQVRRKGPWSHTQPHEWGGGSGSTPISWKADAHCEEDV